MTKTQMVGCCGIDLQMSSSFYGEQGLGTYYKRSRLNEKVVPSILTPDLENTANKTQNGTHGSTSVSAR
jgi:hypothetical protein